MYADRLHRRIDPIGLGASALVAGGMIGALIFAVPQIVRISTLKPLPIHNIPLPVPSPVPEKPHPETRPSANHLPSAPKPLIFPDPIPPHIDAGPVDLGPVSPPNFGDGAAPKTPDPAPSPAFVDAAPDPRFAGDFQPPYPSAMLRSGTEARITVRVLIGTDGHVKQVDPVGTGDAAFFDATRRHALAHWRFKPATRGGSPVETWRTMTVRFQLVE